MKSLVTHQVGIMFVYSSNLGETMAGSMQNKNNLFYSYLNLRQLIEVTGFYIGKCFIYVITIIIMPGMGQGYPSKN